MILIGRKAKSNKYIECDGYTELIIDSPKHGDKVVKIDNEDVAKCKKYKWFVSKCNKQNYDCFYAQANTDIKKNQLMHRFVMNATDDVYIDHRNRDSLDNRKSNLRACNDSTNSMNSKLYRTNKSGHKGVRWDKYLNKWTAYIMKNQKYKHLGYYNSFEDAVKAREEAETKYFGEYNAEL